MDFGYSAEEEQLRATVAKFLGAHCGEAERRGLLDTAAGFDRSVWQRASGELGLPALVIPEEHGGFGASWVATGAVQQEMGAVVCGLPYLSSVLAAAVLGELADAAHRHLYLSALAGGTNGFAVAFDPSFVGRTGAPVGVERSAADPDGDAGPDGDTDQVEITGEFRDVLDVGAADRLLAVVRLAGLPALLALDPAAPGVTVRRRDSLDLTRRQYAVSCAAAPARLLGISPEPALWRAISIATAALAAESVGVAEAALRMSVEYANVREQYGHRIGSFQAVKHLCARMAVAVEQARAAALYALWAADAAPERLEFATHAAASVCTDAAEFTTAANIQVHGGIGYTWEHPAHLYYRRARGAGRLFGSSEYHRQRLYRTAVRAAR